MLHEISSYFAHFRNVNILDNYRRVRSFEALMRQTNSTPNRSQIKRFVSENFAQRDELVDWVPSDWQENPPFIKRIDDGQFRAWAKRINDIWKILSKKMAPFVAEHPERHSLIHVDNGFIVPGGRFQG